MNHQYIKINILERQQPGSSVWRMGAVVMCAVCGEVKNIWSDGVMEVTKEGDKKLHGNRQNN